MQQNKISYRNILDMMLQNMRKADTELHKNTTAKTKMAYRRLIMKYEQIDKTIKSNDFFKELSEIEADDLIRQIDIDYAIFQEDIDAE